MNKSSYLLLLAGLLLLGGCSAEKSPLDADSLRFSEESIRIQIQKYRQVEVFGVKGGKEFPVDNGELEWDSSDPSVVSVVQGILYAKEVGHASVTASSGSLSATLEVQVKDGNSSTGIDAHFKSENIYDLGHKLASPSGIQNFDLDKDGDLYYIQVGARPDFYVNYISKVAPSKAGSETVESSMTCYYLGHPTSMVVENGSDGNTYIWTPELSTKNVNQSSSDYLQYWGAQAIARIKYTPGATLYPWDESIEYFWFGHSGDINVAIDFEKDVLCVTYHISTYLNQTRRVFTYKLSEALALPLVERPFTVTYGGDGAPDEEVTVSKTIKVHDCTKLTPTAHFGIPTDKRFGINTLDWQGFDYNNGLFYFVEGTSYLSMGGSRCALTVFDTDGNIYEERTFVRVLETPDELTAFNITTTGAIESEGVKIRDGAMYLGFASSGYLGTTGNRANVFKYKKAE